MNDYGALAVNGYQWVNIHGPYASTTEKAVERLTNYRTGPTEAQIIEDDKAYYLIRGTIVQIIKEDPASVSGPVGRFFDLPMDLQSISQQAADSGYLWSYRDTGKFRPYPEFNYAGGFCRVDGWTRDN